MLTARTARSAKKRVERERLIEEHVKFVKMIAYQVAAHLPPHVDVNDLISAGTVGLLEAIDKFDSSRGVQFKTYASIRIRGAIMDELRGLDWMTRSMREKSNQLEKAYMEIEKATGRPAEEEEVAEFLNISVEELQRLLSQVGSVSVLNLEDMGVHNHDEGMDILECIEDPKGADPTAYAKFSELKKVIASVLDTLPEKEKLVISLYYHDGLTLKEIGKILSVTESRVCQLHSQAIHRMKSRLKNFDEI